MSILNYLKEYNKDYMPPSVKWRERRVSHRTPSGEINIVKIKSLSPNEQMKYKPIDLIHRDKRAKNLGSKIKSSKSSDEQQFEPQEQIPVKLPPTVHGEVFDFYIGIESNEEVKNIKKNQLFKATLDSAKAVDMEEDEQLHIILAKNVPVDAIKEYMDEDGKWKKIEEEDRDKKADFIKFDDNDFFKIDLFEFKDIIELEPQEEEEMQESIKEHENYLLDTKLLFMFKNNMLSLIKESSELHLQGHDPIFTQKAIDVAKDLDLRYEGFLTDEELEDMPETVKDRYRRSAWFSVKPNPITGEQGTTFMFDMLGDKNDIENKIKDKLDKIKIAFSRPKNMEMA